MEHVVIGGGLLLEPFDLLGPAVVAGVRIDGDERRRPP